MTVHRALPLFLFSTLLGAACTGGPPLRVTDKAPTLRPGGETVQTIDGQPVSLQSQAPQRGVVLVLLRSFS